MKVVTPLQYRNATQRTGCDAVDFAILFVNSQLMNPLSAYAKGPNCTVHQIPGIPVRLSVQEMFDLRERCLAAGWKSVQVVVWQETTCVTLDAKAVRDWTCAMDGKVLNEPVTV